MINRIKAFWEKSNHFSKENEDNARRGRLLNIILVGVLVVSFVAFIAVNINLYVTSSWDDLGNDLILITLLVLMLISIVFFYINQRSVTTASVSFLLVFTAVLTFSDAPNELANGRSSFVFYILIAISSLLLRPASSFLFAFISTIITIILVRLSVSITNFSVIFGFYFLAIISWLSARSLEQALDNLRLVNTNLDQIVVERTNELASALTRERIEAGRNQAILNSIADGVIMFDRQNNATLINPALSEMTEIPAQKLKGISLQDFVTIKDISEESQKSITELIRNPEQSDINPRVAWGEKVLSASVAQVQDSKTNEMIGSVAVFRDITYETQVEKMKDNIVAVVSHELRTPLNAIMGHAEILKEEVYGPLNEKQTSVTSRVMVNVARLLNMVGDLLNEAQIRAGKLSIKPELIKTTSLTENLNQSMEKIVTDKGLELITKVSKEMPSELIGDPQRLQQILINLTNNALKFTEIGSITVSIDRAGHDRWKIEVADTGVGIPENELPFIFEAFRQANNLEFSTRQHGGIGLGLSIVKQLVELMGGEIKVDSKFGKGSIFTVVLPLKTK